MKIPPQIVLSVLSYTKACVSVSTVYYFRSLPDFWCFLSMRLFTLRIHHVWRGVHRKKKPISISEKLSLSVTALLLQCNCVFSFTHTGKLQISLSLSLSQGDHLSCTQRYKSPSYWPLREQSLTQKHLLSQAWTRMSLSASARAKDSSVHCALSSELQTQLETSWWTYCRWES